MSSFTWDSPAYTHGTFSTTVSLIQDFNDKLIAAGLIDYTSGNNSAISAMAAPSSGLAVGEFRQVVTLYYKLPIGNGVIQYDNALSTSAYKVISQASYDSTNVALRFIFGYYNYSTSSINPWNSNVTMILRANMSISTDGGSSWTVFNTDFALSSTAAATASVNLVQKKSNFISLTRNHLSIIWGSINKADESSTTDGIYGRKRHTILFSLYRNNGNIQITYPSTLSTNVTSTAQSHYNNTGSTQIYKYGTSTYTNTTDMSWKFNINGTVNGNIMLQPTLIAIPDNYVNDPGVWCTRINDSQEVYSNSDLIVLYNGLPTKLNFLILSGGQPWYKPYKISKEYSYAYLFDNYTCTTSLL